MAGEPYLYPISISPIFCIPCLLDLGYVYDLTVAYPYAVVESELRIATGHSPREVHFHVRRWPVSQLPKPIEVSRLASDYLTAGSMASRAMGREGADAEGILWLVC